MQSFAVTTSSQLGRALELQSFALLSKLKRAQLGRALDFQNFELAQLGRALDLENFELLSETEIAPEREGFGFAKLRIPFQT